MKKWRPPNRSNRAVELAMSAIGSEDVLLAKMVCLTGRQSTITKKSCGNKNDSLYLLAYPSVDPTVKALKA